MNGLAAGTGVALYMNVLDPFDMGSSLSQYAILLGSVFGVAGCFLSLFMGLFLEKCPGSRIMAAGLLYIYLILSSFSLGWLGTAKGYDFAERVICGAGTALYLTSVTGYTFWPPSIPRGGPKATLNLEPAIQPLLCSARLMSAPLGTVAGVFAVLKVHKM